MKRNSKKKGGKWSKEPPENTIWFYRETEKYGCFSNYSKHSVTIDGIQWKTTEHYFQAKKFEGTKYEERVRKAETPGEAKKLGNRRDFPLRKDWEKVKDKIMYDCVKAKFTQNRSCEKALLSTGDKTLVEHTKNDRYWADAGNGSGKNMLGKILMRVREEIMEEKKNKD